MLAARDFTQEMDSDLMAFDDFFGAADDLPDGEMKYQCFAAYLVLILSDVCTCVLQISGPSQDRSSAMMRTCWMLTTSSFWKARTTSPS